MINFGSGPAFLLGIFLAVAGAGLYFLRSIRPELARDHDIFFSAIALLCGIILLFQGWRLDPILGLGQFLLAGSAVFFAFESVKMRGIATEQAKRNTRIIDDERPVSSRYEYQEAELEDVEPIDDRYIKGRLRGTAEPRRSRPVDDYEEDYRSNSRRYSEQRLGPGQSGQSGQSGRKRNKPSNKRSTERSEDFWKPQANDDWGERVPEADEWGESSSNRERKRRRSQPNTSTEVAENFSEPTPRPRRNRPRPSQSSRSRSRAERDVTATDYVDYQPIERLDAESENLY
ncbi:MAG: Ycf66 family protein [Cyanosarcina radialis HA8281-LM2]|jgi:hypothetical protein|nr:Ycf66 family protein [Cyanosarcina radialis HA8281-LM2]